MLSRSTNSGQAVPEDQSPVKSPFRVVLAYDGPGTVAFARKLVRRFIREYGSAFEFYCDVWRFDVLDLPEVASTAAKAGEEADLIIVAGEVGMELPDGMKRWLERSLAFNPAGSIGLAAFFLTSSDQCGMDDSGLRYLQEVSTKTGAEFFYQTISDAHSGARSPQ